MSDKSEEMEIDGFDARVEALTLMEDLLCLTLVDTNVDNTSICLSTQSHSSIKYISKLQDVLKIKFNDKEKIV